MKNRKCKTHYKKIRFAGLTESSDPAPIVKKSKVQNQQTQKITKLKNSFFRRSTREKTLKKKHFKKLLQPGGEMSNVGDKSILAFLRRKPIFGAQNVQKKVLSFSDTRNKIFISISWCVNNKYLNYNGHEDQVFFYQYVEVELNEFDLNGLNVSKPDVLHHKELIVDKDIKNSCM